MLGYDRCVRVLNGPHGANHASEPSGKHTSGKMSCFVWQCITAHCSLAGGEKCEVGVLVGCSDDLQQSQWPVVQHELALGGLLRVLHTVTREVDPIVVLEPFQDGIYDPMIVP